MSVTNINIFSHGERSGIPPLVSVVAIGIQNVMVIVTGAFPRSCARVVLCICLSFCLSVTVCLYVCVTGSGSSAGESARCSSSSDEIAISFPLPGMPHSSQPRRFLKKRARHEFRDEGGVQRKEVKRKKREVIRNNKTREINGRAKIANLQVEAYNMFGLLYGYGAGMSMDRQ